MLSKPVVFGLVAAACVTAAAGGAFVAVRQNAADQAAVAVPQAPANGPAAQPVSETEAVLTPTPAAQPSDTAQKDAKESVTSSPTQAAEAPEPVAKSSASRTTSAVSSSSSRTRNQEEKPRTQAGRTEPRPQSTAPLSPSSSSSTAAAAEQPRETTTAAPVLVPEQPQPETPRPAEVVSTPPEPQFVEVTVPASSVIGLQLDRAISSESAKLEDRVEARVTRDVVAGGRTAIPAGARVLGSVTTVERGGKIKQQARLGVRFHTLVLANGTEIPLRSETIFRDGESPGGESARKIGGAAAGGAILGAILGGGKGAMIGGATGAGAGTAAVMAGDRNAATLRSGEIVTIRLSEPVNIDVARN
jgi:type IV secretory pathway VirB10-like protein